MTNIITRLTPNDLKIIMQLQQQTGGQKLTVQELIDILLKFEPEDRIWVQGCNQVAAIQEDAIKVNDSWAEVVIQVKVGDDDQLFESVTQQKIADKLKESGFEVKKNQILLESPIKLLGEYPVKVRLEHNLEPEIKVMIIEEK